MIGLGLNIIFNRDIFMNDKGEDGYGRKQLFKGNKTYREKGPDFSKKDRGFTVEKPKNTGS